MRLALGLILVVLGQKPQISPNEAYKIDSGVTKLKAFQSVLETDGDTYKNPYGLKTNRPELGIKHSELQNLLPHALLSVCTRAQVDSGTCFCGDNFKRMHIIRNSTMDSQTAVLIDSRNKLVVVSYRLTVSDKNWETSGDGELVPHPALGNGEKVHKGYLKHFISTQPASEAAVLHILKNPIYKDHTLHITGFSLGGSISAISAPAWSGLLQANQLNHKIRLFLYSSPRPGNLAFSNHLDSLNIPILRYARNKDLVPHLPLQKQGYCHVGSEFYQVDSNEIKACSNKFAEDPSCALGDSAFDPGAHFHPFDAEMPTPTFCQA